MKRRTVARGYGVRFRALVASACPALAAAAGAAGVGTSSSAWAQFTTLSGNVGTSQGPVGQQSITDNPNASLSGLQSEDAVGNDAVAGGTLEAFNGRFRLSSHACSGGQDGFGGQANAIAQCNVIQDYQVVSTTLPAGTPVMITIRWAVTGRATAAGNLTYWAYGALGTLNGHVSITVGGNSLINVSGERRREYNTTNGYYHFITGTLNPEEDHREHAVIALVGQQVRLSISGAAGGNSIAASTDVADGDSQLSMMWGINSEDPNASVVSLTYPDPDPTPPPATQATIDNCRDYLPERRPGLPECFTFSTQPGAASACVSADTSFSVTADGTGPFSYQWRHNNEPVDAGTNPSAATATLSLTGVTAADAGSYTVEVTNPCGSRTSNAALLTVTAPPTISMQPGAASACVSTDTGFSVSAAGTGPIYYEWYHNGEPIDADANPSATTPTLSLTGVTAADAGSYTVEVTNPCGTITSNAATLTICAADFNCSGTISVQDIFDFLAAYFAGAPAADFNHAGGISVQDIFDYLAAYFAGC